MFAGVENPSFPSDLMGELLDGVEDCSISISFKSSANSRLACSSRDNSCFGTALDLCSTCPAVEIVSMEPTGLLVASLLDDPNGHHILLYPVRWFRCSTIQRQERVTGFLKETCECLRPQKDSPRVSTTSRVRDLDFEHVRAEHHSAHEIPRDLILIECTPFRTSGVAHDCMS